MVATIFFSSNADTRPTLAYDRLLSPYTVDDPVDHDGLYETLRTRRTRVVRAPSPPLPNIVRAEDATAKCRNDGVLFAPYPDAENGVQGSEEDDATGFRIGFWQTALSQGVGALLDGFNFFLSSDS